MDTTIRNLDVAAYRGLKARAAQRGKTVGEVMNDAIRFYLARSEPATRAGSLAQLVPERYPRGNKRLSEEIDRVVYGVE